MSKLVTSPLFRALVCLLVICCLVINISPIKAEATAVAGTAISLSGLLAMMYSMAIGVVAVDLTVETINKIGADLEETIITEVDTTELERWNNLKKYYEEIQPDPPEDPGEWKSNLEKWLSRGILASIAGWLCTLVNMGGYEVEEGTTLAGYAYYNGVLLPKVLISVNDDVRYSYLLTSNGQFAYDYIWVWSNVAATYTGYPGIGGNGFALTYYGCNVDSDSWTALKSDSSVGSGRAMLNYYGDVFWCSTDILCTDGSIWLAASEPSLSQTTIIEPSIYVGDIPQQIQDGEIDEETLELPVIDPYIIFSNPDLAYTNLNNYQQQLMDGTITLDQYNEAVKLQTSTNPDSGEDSGDSTNPSTGTDTGTDTGGDSGGSTTDSVTDITSYGLELSEYFPFCIPFDIYDFFSVLIAEPEAPQFHWELQDLSGNTYAIDVDLSPWNSLAALFRSMQLLLFIVGLAAASRKFIKW